MGGEKCKSPVMDIVQWNLWLLEVRFLDSCRNSHKLRILQMNFSNVGTLTNRGFYR
ncbi:hypothetical protein LEP1GSC065_0139 [Leptospira kirschneri serovar Sokoine str. RM1]|nr:hypothetical protein LEP1GSC065_0139 [Leptospira kirschneri serovar Sokoine str. RM1]